MNVWLVNQYAVPPSEPGITRHYTLARELIKRGHKAVVVATSFNHQVRRETRLGPRETCKWEVIQSVPFLWVRTPPYHENTLRRAWNMAVFTYRVWSMAAAQGLQGPDVVVGSSPHLLGALAAQHVAGRKGIPFVLEVRDIWPQSLVDLGGMSRNHPATRVLSWVEAYLYRRADRIVSVLPYGVEHMVARGAERSKVVWVPNGVDLSTIPPPVPPSGHHVLTAMYSGAHGLANGLDVLLDAAAVLRRRVGAGKIRLRLVGDGPEKPRLQRRAQREGIGIVEFWDSVPKDSIYRLLREADLFLMVLRDSPVYRWGVSPNKLFDYMAMARPVVYGVRSPTNPVAEAGAGLTVPPDDPSAMAQAMEQLASMSTAERWQMGLRGREYVERYHDYSCLADTYESLLAEVTQARHCGT